MQIRIISEAHTHITSASMSVKQSVRSNRRLFMVGIATSLLSYTFANNIVTFW